MEDLGYLDDPADRLGMLDGQRMRAARVVLDIGVHLGKQRPDGDGAVDGDYALEFLAQNVNMNEAFVRFEVNRYLGWPGQAPSYKVGQRIWEQLRDEVARREGALRHQGVPPAGARPRRRRPRHPARGAAGLSGCQRADSGAPRRGCRRGSGSARMERHSCDIHVRMPVAETNNAQPRDGLDFVLFGAFTT